MGARRICKMATIANIFLDKGNIKSYNYMKQKIYKEVHDEQRRVGKNDEQG